MHVFFKGFLYSGFNFKVFITVCGLHPSNNDKSTCTFEPIEKIFNTIYDEYEYVPISPYSLLHITFHISTATLVVCPNSA